MYHDFAVKNGRLEPGNYLTAARVAASRADNGPMLEDLGVREKESGNFTSAISYLQQARALYTKPDDILRTLLEQADAPIKAGDKKAALALVRSVARVAPDAPATALLRKIDFRGTKMVDAAHGRRQSPGRYRKQH
jgi:tetratricopeptide (TPR) repeat protein